MALSRALKSPYAKPTVFVLCLLPLVSIIWRVLGGDLGANPVETVTHETGDWALRFLLITLAITPIRVWSGNVTIARFRRMLGLYVFFYAFCHFLIWFVADHSLNLGDMFEDVIKRPYITLGFSAFLILIPLAATSNQAMLLKLGKRWKSLHKLTYVVVILAILHFIWQVKADYLESGIYAVIAFALLLQRVKFRQWGRKKNPPHERFAGIKNSNT